MPDSRLLVGDVHTLLVEQELDEEVMKAALTAIGGRILKVDHTFKIPKVRLFSVLVVFPRASVCARCYLLLQAVKSISASSAAQFAPFQALYGVMNEYSQIVCFKFVKGKGADEVIPILQGIKRRYELQVCLFLSLRMLTGLLLARTGRCRRSSTATTAALIALPSRKCFPALW